MWHLNRERHKHHQPLCKWLQQNCSPCKECKTHVILMLRICYKIPGTKYRRQLGNMTRRLGDRNQVILGERVQGTVRAIQNTRVFLTETWVVADVLEEGGQHVLYSDACRYEVGAVHSLKREHFKTRGIYCWSRKLQCAEMRDPISNRELLAIWDTMVSWYCQLHSDIDFTVQMDHISLWHILTNIDSQHAKWSM